MHGTNEGYCPRTGKLKYETKSEARKTLEAMKHRYDNPRRRGRGQSTGKLNVYQCTICTCWHVGNRR